MTDLSNDPVAVNLRQRYGNAGLLRFAAGWGVALSLVALFTPWLPLGVIGLICAVVVIVLTNVYRRGIRAALAEHMLFNTPEGRDALRYEAGRRLRDGDY